MWMSLSRETRNHLIKVFDLKKNGVTEVRDQEVITDGYTTDDLKAINLGGMCEYIGSEETFGRAWEITLAKVHSELNPPIGEIKSVDGEPTIVDAQTPMEKIMTEQLVKVGIDVILDESEPIKPWCDTCDSKGVRHLKECPKYVPIPPRGSANEFAKQLQ